MYTGHVQGIGQVTIPDKEFIDIPENYYPRVVHGSTCTIAVFNAANDCVGWYELIERDLNGPDFENPTRHVK